jgi:hypothetical protein
MNIGQGLGAVLFGSTCECKVCLVFLIAFLGFLKRLCGEQHDGV